MNNQKFSEVLTDLIAEQNTLLNQLKNTTEEKDFKKIEKEINLNTLLIKILNKYIQFQFKKAENA